MFTLTATVEYIVIALACALLYGLCTFKILGALQQAGYNGKKYAAWTHRRGNMVYSRFILLAFLTVLAMLVLGICFSFAGAFAGYIALIPIPLFASLYCVADKRALKVPLVSTARANRIYLLNVLVIAVAAFVLGAAGNAVSYYCYTLPENADWEILSHLRYLPLALLPILLPVLLRVANLLEKPFSYAKNKKFVERAREKLHSAPCVKIGITGSFGKTSVKNFLAAILSVRYRVLATPESFNTPLGIARAVDGENLADYDIFIAEMGARNKGDIAELCDLVSPDHCMITGICPQHVESFGGIENIIAAKGEILAGTKKGGFAVVGQDENTDKLDVAAAGLIKVSVGEHGEFGAFDVVSSPSGISFKLALGIVQCNAHSKLLGAHNAQNIALAAALAFKLGLSKEEILQGIEKIDYVPHRLQPTAVRGVTILDDAYNANVVGAAAAIEVLRSFEGRKLVVTPGLVELGVLEEKENAELGKKLVGLDKVILVGETLVSAVKNGYLAAGGEAEKLVTVPTLEAAQDLLEGELAEGDTVLFLNDLPDIYN